MKQTKMLDKDYLLYLRDRQEEMRQDILMCCTTKRSGLFVDVFTVYKKLKEKYHEGWEKEQGEDVMKDISVVRKMGGHMDWLL